MLSVILSVGSVIEVKCFSEKAATNFQHDFPVFQGENLSWRVAVMAYAVEILDAWNRLQLSVTRFNADNAKLSVRTDAKV